MTTTKISTRLTIPGLVCIACVAVAFFAQPNRDIDQVPVAPISANQSSKNSQVELVEPIPGQPIKDHDRTRIPNASRIPVIDGTGTPKIQLARFESVEWVSQTESTAVAAVNTDQSIPPKFEASSSRLEHTQPIVAGTPFNDFLPWKRPETIADQTEDGSLTPVENQSPAKTQIEQETQIVEQSAQGEPVDDSHSTLKSGKPITDSQSVAHQPEPSAGPVIGNDEVSPPAPETNQFQPTNTDGLATNSLPALLNEPAFDDFVIEQPRVAVPGENEIAPRVAKATPATQIPEPALLIDQAPQGTPCLLQCASNFVLAAEPEAGVHWKDDRPVTDNCSQLIDDPIREDFSPDPNYSHLPYDPYNEMRVYEGKTLNANQRPILELGRPWYQLGQLSPGSSKLGKHNNVVPQFLIYGDTRVAIASNTQNGDNITQIAFEVNLDFDLKLTSTERFHMFMSPVDNGQNTRWLLDDNEFVDLFDADIDFGYFEGDLGALVGGCVNKTLPFDLPFALGIMPLLLQNGVWMEDAFLGVAVTRPARNIPKLNVSNMDITFFAGYDKINSDAFPGDDSAARMYGFASFIEAMNGYFEIDYAYLEDRTNDNRSYHNIGAGFSRRFGRLLSNSNRIIINAGQSTDVVENTADGVLLLSENSLITSSPSTLVPYMNFFAGFDRPQSAARAGAAGGVLRNTGILFESDGMTNYPTLDATANDTYGGSLGLNLLAQDFSQQLIVETSLLGVIGEDATRNSPGPQYGVGFRYQLPLSNAVIFRADGMYGFLEDREDVKGLRFELRHKY